ncbi:hypothetical protein [Arthrobacter oryzae]|uniref:Uncharacterized protein n=1 Tax=Arthrobacter oryzae TaxID=409290 RepID=A0A3N0CEV7_9MICC|nr:hypothetical protein [Arthrobacter oryzae]RNL61543.1 hypothetical protein D7003_01180 [Arthrobacter oryzae]
MPNRYRLKGSTLEEIRQKAELQYGPSARIVSAERVISPGIAGLFAGDHYEAMVAVGPPDETITGEVVPDSGLLADAGQAGTIDGPVRSFRPPARFSRAARESIRTAVPAQPVPAPPVPGRTAPAGKKPARPASAQKHPLDLAGARTASASAVRDTPEVPAARSHQLQGAAIAALLEEADDAERGLHDQGPSGVSTESPDFAELLEQLGAGLKPAPEPAATPVTGDTPAGTKAGADPVAPVDPGAGADPRTAAAPPGVPAPAPLTGIGDLVLLVGLGEDALDTALAMSTAAGGADVRTGGALSAYGHLHVDGRQGATAARAHAVMTDRTVLVAYGLNRAREAAAIPQALAALAADQIWLVVDAGRKHDDTARWVNELASQLTVTAIAVVGAAETGTPESVNGLGIPLGWIDNRRARAGQL